MAGINELKQKIESDADFKDSLQKSADVKEFMGKIKAAGFEVTPEELANTISGENGEVSDDELEAVAGGGSRFWKDFWTGFKYGIVNPIGGIKAVVEELS